VVIHAQVDPPAPRLAVGAHDHHRGRLAPAHVPALGLRAFERGHQTRGEISLGRLERGAHGRRDGVAQHHVRLAGRVRTEHVAGAGHAALAGMRRDAARRVDDPDLAQLGHRVRGEQRGQRRLGRLARRQPIEPVRAVCGLDDRLRGHGADARPRPRAQRADGEPMRLHRSPELAGGRSRATIEYVIAAARILLR
jgi:hypothetical protein